MIVTYMTSCIVGILWIEFMDVVRKPGYFKKITTTIFKRKERKETLENKLKKS